MSCKANATTRPAAPKARNPGSHERKITARVSPQFHTILDAEFTSVLPEYREDTNRIPRILDLRLRNSKRRHSLHATRILDLLHRPPFAILHPYLSCFPCADLLQPDALVDRSWTGMWIFNF